MMGMSLKALILFMTVGLAACPAPGTHTAAPTGASVPDMPSETVSDGDISSGPGVDAPPPPNDVTSNQPGAGGSMPTGTLAPHPLVPVNFLYKAEGTYCRFEGDSSQAMIWGRLYKLVGDGQFESEPKECTDDCKNKDLKVFFQRDGLNINQTVSLEDAPDFRFTIEIDDPKKFGLTVIYQKTVAIIGQDPIPAGQGAFVDVSAFQPYRVDGVPAFCPDRILMQRSKIPQPIELRPIEKYTP